MLQSSGASVAIIGAGQAGIQVAMSLRRLGFAGKVRLFGDEPFLPYQRPPLSKSYLLEDFSFDRLQLRSGEQLARNDIEVITHERVARICPEDGTIVTEDDTSHRADRIVLATGSSNRRLPLSAKVAGIVSLRGIADADALGSALAAVQSVVVIGAGFVGLELAASIGKMGKSVTVIEAAPQVMGRTSSPQLAAFTSALHQANGVTILTSAQLRGYSTDQHGNVAGVRLANGDALPAQVVIEAVGAIPNVALAQQAGIECDNGVLVDNHMRTSNAKVYAVGDVANFYSPRYQQRLRLESVNNAIDQANQAATAIVADIGGGEAAGIYQPVPWFWTDQFTTKIQMVGVGVDTDQVCVRGTIPTEPEQLNSASFSLFSFGKGKLLTVESVNRPADHMVCRRLMASGRDISPQQAQDEQVNLKTLLS